MRTLSSLGIWISVGCLGMALAGCAVRSVHDREFVSTSLSERTGQKLRRQSGPGSAEIPAGVVLEDGLSPEEAVAVALWNNARFQAGLVELGFARADLVEAGLLRNPIFSFLFPLGPKQLEYTLSLPFEFLWQRPRRVAAARLDAERVADLLVQSGLDLVRDVQVAFADWVRERNRVRLTGEISELMDDLAEIANARLELGDISGLEASSARLAASAAQEASVVARRDEVISAERLTGLMGMGERDSSLEPVPESFSPGKQPDPSLLVPAAFAARPDLRAAEIKIEAAAMRAGWERSRIFNFTAMLDANGEGKQGYEMGPGLQLELPVLSQNNGKILRTRAEMEKAAREYIALRQQIVREVKEACADLSGAQRNWEEIRFSAVPAAAEAAEQAEAAYACGEISYPDWIAFRLALLHSRMRESDAEAGFRRAAAELRRCVGLRFQEFPDQAPGVVRTGKGRIS